MQHADAVAWNAELGRNQITFRYVKQPTGQLANGSLLTSPLYKKYIKNVPSHQKHILP